MPTFEQVLAVKEKHKKDLLSKPGVNMVSVGRKNGGEELAVIVNVVKKLPMGILALNDVLPRTLDGVKVDVVEAKEIKVNTLAKPTDRFRPAQGGVSIGHKDITAGTFGCLVKDGADLFILSNNHVLANSNDAEAGDAILQPGPHDGGTEENDTIATLADFVPIVFDGETGGGLPPVDGCDIGAWLEWLLGLFGGGGQPPVEEPTEPAVNLFDAALAKPINDTDVKTGFFGLEGRKITGVGTVNLDMPLLKSGRTTGVTSDKVLQMHATVQVQYGEGQVATFEEQFVAGPMSQGGDSGSAVLNINDEIVGLLFAGSDEFTIISPIQPVLETLAVEVVLD
jgi:hypothetical protein